MLDLGGPLQVMATLAELNIADVNVQCISPQNNVVTFQQVGLNNIAPLPDRIEPDDVIFATGSKLSDELMTSSAWRDAATWLKEKFVDQANPPHVAGICTGTFLLGDAGLLDGRACTTHHDFIQRLQRLHPKAEVAANRLSVQDGKLWTSAGVATGMDLALQMIAQTFGDHAALRVARENVLQFRRFGNDPELSPSLRYRNHGNNLVHSLQDEILKDLSKPVTGDELARKAGFSTRHLVRLFKAETGITVKQYQLELRMELARHLILGSSMSMERVAARCGFSSVQAFRSLWNRREAISPSKLREQGEIVPVDNETASVDD